MFSQFILSSALVAAVAAHQNLHQFWVNGETPGYEVGIRPSGNGNNPVTDVTSIDIVCNVPSTTKPSSQVEVVPVIEGNTIKVQWDSSSHPGPITHMLAGPFDDVTAESGKGAWVKVDELDYVDGKWANELMQAVNMTHEFTLPIGLASGQYLLRSEMLALHGAQTIGGAQFYIGCMQIKVTGTGSAGSCTPSIELPGAYNANDANIYIPNVYNGFDPTNYTAPGGPVASCGGSGSGSSITSKIPSSTVLPISSAATSSATETSAATTPVSDVPATDVAATSAAIAPSSSLTTSAPTSTLVPPTSTATTPTTGAGGEVAKYGQCGGKNYSGATACASGSTCKVQNDYYSQCV
ncbi:carbohydrate-binding module family 1 protein [Lentithecium fluviatile CBS 122367]|uniref:AA9 family lytic polysaccharide monooxygenase n=1 Tax=Lentithecium fluviatile CBS 122367 TaxID=1168545 RepID=A0A6G1IRY2_9PLEO|nr:carbohydrate-binding module family 1 protein [Lentithecium fluviatile CBS 122367]